jgi:hypothetical protein
LSVIKQYGYLATDGLEQLADNPDIAKAPTIANPHRSMLLSRQ